MARARIKEQQPVSGADPDLEQLLDEALAQTFPASDPVALSCPAQVREMARRPRSQTNAGESRRPPRS
jgi:hypothetical protein